MFAGKPAFTAKAAGGYHTGKIFDRQEPAHRVIYKWMTGEDPDVIDHINGHPSDNRWENLRSVTTAKNLRNTKISKNNTSGWPGVYFIKPLRKWRAQIRFQGRTITGGHHKKLEDAIAARIGLEKQYGFTTRYDGPRCPICLGALTHTHDHREDNTGIDDGPPIETVRKKYTLKPSTNIQEVRAKAWATRRKKYGQYGHR